MRTLKIIPFVFALLLLTALVLDDAVAPPSGTDPIPPSRQDTTGDALAGWDFLRYGDYIGGGIPYDVFVAFPQNTSPANLLKREGDNAVLPPGFNAFTALSGARVVGGMTCFGCHAATLDGRFLPGLGNSLSDFTQNTSTLFDVADRYIGMKYGQNSAQWYAYHPLSRSVRAAARYTIMPFRGVNPAFMVEQASMAYRDTNDLRWIGLTSYPIPLASIGSDVPPLWTVRKKNALYYNGMGRGDFTKMLMQVTVVAIRDSTEARRIQQRFVDVLAYLRQLEPPAFPGAIDRPLAARGEQLYTEHCASCHGTYGPVETYPNLLVSLERVGTDPAYAQYFIDNGDFTAWFNRSWYAKSTPRSRAQPAAGYVAPPLDGVWATAPYLHNGSVPTLADLLDSRRRPVYWRRNFVDNEYDYQQVGWKYTVENAAYDNLTYDTTVYGYGKDGHAFSDKLSDEERRALLEYLKTL